MSESPYVILDPRFAKLVNGTAKVEKLHSGSASAAPSMTAALSPLPTSGRASG